MKKSNRSTSTSKRSVRSRQAGDGVVAYFETRQKEFLAALIAARRYYAVEGIHDLRVEIKRLRALYRLIEYAIPSFASKPSAEPLKPIFRSAGKLRDIDIHQAIVTPRLTQLDLREYFNFLKQEELELRGDLDKVARGYSEKTFAPMAVHVRSSIAAVPADRMKNRLEKRIAKLTRKLEKLFAAPDLSNDELHAVRKTTKTLRYTFDVWQQCFGKLAAAEAATVQLKKVYGYLGEWRDASLTHGSVVDFLKRKLDGKPEDKAAYEKVQAELLSTAKKQLSAYNRGKSPLRKALREFAVKAATSAESRTRKKQP